MSEKRLRAVFGAEVVVNDECGNPLSLIIDEKGGDYARVGLTVEEARELARTLNAFAQIRT